MEKSDEQLIQEYQQGNVEAFNILAGRYQNVVYSFAHQLCRNATVAEDITQDAFMLAYAACRKYEPKAKFITWLYRIVRNLAYNYLKQQGRYKMISWSLPSSSEKQLTMADVIPGYVPTPEQVLETKEAANLMQVALDSLPEHHRQIMILRYYQGLSYQEIADVMGCSIGTVKSRLFYSTRLLKAKFLALTKS